jgi:hypothetical protein
LAGRQAELREVKRLLTTTRLPDLTESGGAGKTRLALRGGRDGPRLPRRGLAGLADFGPGPDADPTGGFHRPSSARPVRRLSLLSLTGYLVGRCLLLVLPTAKKG